MVPGAAGKIKVFSCGFLVYISNQVFIVRMLLYIKLSIDVMECICMLDNEIKT